MAWLTWLINSRLGRAVGAAVGLLLAVWAIWAKGVRSERQKQERENLEEYRNVRQRADEALRDHDGDTRPVDERLREKGALRD